MTDVSFVVRTPRCPVCDSPPAFVGVLPWFCSNDACGLVSWHPEDDLETNRAAIVLVHDLTCPLAAQPVTDERDPRCTCPPPSTAGTTP